VQDAHLGIMGCRRSRLQGQPERHLREERPEEEGSRQVFAGARLPLLQLLRLQKMTQMSPAMTVMGR